jgi:hypothetical protein
MNSALWVVQGLLALVFLYSGGKKLLRSTEQIQALLWARDLTPTMVRGIGILEVLGAVGLIVPMLTGILLWLTSRARVRAAGAARHRVVHECLPHCRAASRACL